MTLQERFAELNTQTSADAEALAVQGKRAKAWYFVFPPFGRFLSTYIAKGEWRHGAEGLTSALFAAYSVFATYTKLWEMQKGLTYQPLEPQGDSDSTTSDRSHSGAAEPSK